jgi:hypothetical protein
VRVVRFREKDFFLPLEKEFPMICRLFLIATALATISPHSSETKPAKAEKAGLEQEVGDISGYYTCRGLETGGKSYNGVAVISKKNDVYVVQWMVGGGSTFAGIGIRQGAAFSASWAIPGERGLVRGVNMYKIEPGPRLVGRWATLPGAGNIQSETLTFLKNIEEEE